MRRKTVFVMLLVLLVFGILMTTFNIQPVEASGTVYINADGSISPPTTPIQRDGEIYTFTANISDSIVVEKDNIVIDGASHTLQGSGGDGFWLWERTGITIRNLEIKGFQYGIVAKCSDCQFTGNVIVGNAVGINLQGTENSVSENTIDESQYNGITVQPDSSRNNIAGNTVTGSGETGIDVLGGTSSNTLSANTISASGRAGISLWNTVYNTVVYNEIKNNAAGIEIGMNAEGNTIFHNNFTGNTKQVLIDPNPPLANTWDDGYPSGGNWWSDYIGADAYHGVSQDIAGSDGIGDTPYAIDENNTDNYPLMRPWAPTQSVLPVVVGIHPEALNLRSNGKWITAYIALPKGYDVNDINVSSIMLNNTIPVETHHSAQRLMVKFDRERVIQYILGSVRAKHKFMTITLTLTGKLDNGIPFQGSDTLKIMRCTRSIRHHGFFHHRCFHHGRARFQLGCHTVEARANFLDFFG